MPNSRLETLVGPMGELGSSRGPAVQALKDKGIAVSPNTISQMRIGVFSGEMIAGRVESAMALDRNDAVLKDRFFLKLAHVGEFYRRYQRRPNEGLLSPTNFAGSISEYMRIDGGALRMAVRGARTNLVYEETRKPSDPFVEKFQETASGYLNDYSRSEYAIDVIDQLNDHWDETIKGFYTLFYQTPGGKGAIKTWLPYELDVFKTYFEGRFEEENTLTPFDKRVLEARVKLESADPVAQEIEAQSGLPTDIYVLSAYRNLILHGTPRGTEI